MPPIAGEQTPKRQFDKMLLLEVSANLYGTWGTSWKDCLQMDQHLSCLRFFLWILSRAISSNVSYFFETVMDRHGAPHSHRMWLPLTPENRDQFVTECAGAMPLWREAKAAKIQKIKRPVSAGSNLELKGMYSQPYGFTLAERHCQT